MQLLLFIVSLFFWSLIIYFTTVNDIPGDGAAFIGFPKPFIEIHHDEVTGEFVKTWDYFGVTLNIVLLILIYMGLSLLRKKALTKKPLGR
jgi:hypothetical protein